MTQREISDAALVRRQYADTNRLTTRAAVWQDTPDGRNPRRAALQAILDAAPATVLDLGCGAGDFTAQLAAGLPNGTVVGLDQSPAMATSTRDRGVGAAVGSATALPFVDHAFDVVYAGWMLYHVADLDAAFTEVARVLKPGGKFVAATNGDEHLAGLLAEVGARPPVTGFSSENGERSLSRHFGSIAREDFDTRAVFADAEAARAYLATYDPQLPPRLADFTGSRTYTGAATVFVARVR